MSDDHAYIANYVADRLYVNPSARGGTYVSIAAEQEREGSGETEEILGEINVSERTRFAVSMFYVTDRNDWNRLKLTKLQRHKTYGWRLDSEIALNRFGGEKLGTFLEILSSLDLAEPTKAKIDLGDVRVGQFSTLLKTDRGKKLVERLSQSPDLEHDIVAVAARRRALVRFEGMLTAGNVAETQWQAFFQANP